MVKTKNETVEVHRVMGELSDELFEEVQEYIALHNVKNFSKLTMQRIIALALSEFVKKGVHEAK